MNILSLFDGMSCAQIALNRAGIPITKYYASEIDKYAITVTQANYPNTIQLGSIVNVKADQLPKIDLLIGGSPCQGFSVAGKKLNFNDERSRLFFEFVRLLNEVKPTYFLLENVKMKSEWVDIISNFLGVGPIEINSALVSAQNRKRLYWTNIPNITQPKDKGILLKDIIEEGVVDRDKSYCIDACYSRVGDLGSYLNRSRRQLVFNSPVAFTERRTEEAKQIRREHQAMGKDFSPRRAKELIAREDGKMNCLTATYSEKEHSLIDEQFNYRKLTSLECERLQTVPDHYTAHVSNSQRYKMLGNGFTVDVIAHILSFMNKSKPRERAEQFGLFGEGQV